MIKFRWETQFQKTELGEIPQEWDIVKLGKLADIKTGKTNVQDAVDDGKYPLFDRSDELKRSDKYLFDTEAVIVPGEGKDFLPRYYIGKFDLHQRTYAIFNFKPNLKGKYLYFAMFMLRHYLREWAVGSTVLSLRLPLFKQLPVPLPPPDEQARIATVLSWFDDLIENKKRQNEILEKTAMAIFKSWFVDFEPFQDEEFVYNKELGREVPRGWEVRPIGEVAEFLGGFSYKSSEKLEEPVENSYLFITLKNTVEGGGFNPDYAWVKSERLKERHFLSEGDIILPNTEQTKDARLLGSTGIVVFPPDYSKKVAVFSMDIVKAIPHRSFQRYYLYFYIMSNREEVATFHSGTSILHFKIKNFKENFKILLPPAPILQRFHEMVEPLFRKIINNEKEIMVLKKARDALLPLLVFGKLRVEEI